MPALTKMSAALASWSRQLRKKAKRTGFSNKKERPALGALLRSVGYCFCHRFGISAARMVDH
jgi:hypothetical protein